MITRVNWDIQDIGGMHMLGCAGHSGRLGYRRYRAVTDVQDIEGF